MMDDASDYCWSEFLKQKSELADRVINKIRDLKAKGIANVKVIRCDNAGENISLKQKCEALGLGINFEFTARNTPQQNGRIERKFVTLYGRVRSMMNSAKLPAHLRNGLWTEAALSATLYENIVVTDTRKIPAYELLYKKEKGQARQLRTFGEMAVFATREKIQNKMADRGKLCMFLGYSDDHDDSTYRMMNITTRKVIHTRDIIWLNQSYGDYYQVQQPMIVEIEDTEDDDFPDTIESIDQEGRVNDDDTFNQEGRQTNVVTPTPARQQRNTRLRGEMQRLQAYFNEDATRTLETLNEDLNEAFEETEQDGANYILDTLTKNFAFLTQSVLTEKPKTAEKERKYGKQDISFQEAWNHTNPECREKWREAIRKEFHCMNLRKVWRKVKKNTIPFGRRLIKCRWVFEIKRDG